MQDREDIQQRFQALGTWKRVHTRAPHKPLLALWAIGRCLRGEPRLVDFGRIDRELAELLRRFGPHRKADHTEYPFWRMQRDGIWEIDRPELVGINSAGDAYKRDLRRHQICGGLYEADYMRFQEDPALARDIAERIVTGHFPATLQDAVLEATSIPTEMETDTETTHTEVWVTRRHKRRDKRFRALVLAAYGEQCAVCKFAVRHLDKPVALEAAHIKWHEYRGPASVENGLALCSLHHDLFDTGAFTILPELRVIVSGSVKGVGVNAALKRYHDRPLCAPPLADFPRPNPKFLAWHQREVFKDPETLR